MQIEMKKRGNAAHSRRSACFNTLAAYEVAKRLECPDCHRDRFPLSVIALNGRDPDFEPAFRP